MNRVYETTFAVPAGTPIAAPASLPVVLEDANLDTVRIIIPDGHFGLTGLRITWAGTQILPYNTGTWITSNNEIIDWPADDEITELGIKLLGYNLDAFVHSFYLRFQISDLTGTPVALVSSAQLAPAVTSAAQLDVGQLAVLPPAPPPPPPPIVVPVHLPPPPVPHPPPPGPPGRI